MFYSFFPLKGSTYAQLGKSLSKGNNLWEVREAGEGNSKKSLGNIQPPERPGIGKNVCAREYASNGLGGKKKLNPRLS